VQGESEEEENKPANKAAGASTSGLKPSPEKGKSAKSPEMSKAATACDESEDEETALPCKKRAKVDPKQEVAC
jgi:hypothetical protein